MHSAAPPLPNHKEKGENSAKRDEAPGRVFEPGESLEDMKNSRHLSRRIKPSGDVLFEACDLVA